MTLKINIFTRFVLKAILSLTLLGATPQYSAAQNACVGIIGFVGINVNVFHKVANKDSNNFIVPCTQNGDPTNKHQVAVHFFNKNETLSSLTSYNNILFVQPMPVISGKTLVCPNEEVTYTTPFVGNGTTWQWTVQSGGTITQTNNNSIKIRWNNAPSTVNHIITVVEKDAQGNTASANLPVSIKTTTLRCAGSFTTSLDNSCKTTLSTDMVLIGTHIGFQEMKMQLLSGTTVLEEGIGSIEIDGISKNGTPYELINKTYAYKIIEPCSNNSCGANITFEDGVPPMVTAPKDAIYGCTQVGQASTPFPQSAGEPLVIDCSSTSYTYTDESFETLCTQPFTILPNGVPSEHVLPNTGDIIRIVLRTFRVKDKWNNINTCQQAIFIRKGKVEQVICPQDIEFSCQEGRTPLSLTQTGVPVIDNDGDFSTTNDRFPLDQFTCQMSYKFVDDTFRLCGGSFKIVRLWTIFDWCAVDNPATPQDERRKECSQIIKVLDKTPPSVLAYYTQHYSNGSSLITVDTTAVFEGYAIQGGASYEPFGADIYPLANINNCGANVRFTIKATDINCTNKQISFVCSDSRLKIANGYPIFDSQTGVTTVVYEGSFTAIDDYIFFIEAKDECGYALSKKRFRLRVRDNLNPQATCKTGFQAALNTGGVARVEATTFSDNSYDNCGIVRYEIRRINNCQNSADTLFKPYIDFYCCDAAQSHMVILRVWDAAGNYNDCMSSVFVNDKTRPTCVAPAPKVVNCKELDINNLTQYGLPLFWDNCSIRDTTYSVVKDLNSCGLGTITRKWAISDNSNLTSECSQIITITGKSDFIVDFPDDMVANCFAAIPTHAQLREKLLKGTLSEDGHIINNGCGIMAVNIKDDTLSGGSTACYVIYRKISVIDMCKYTGINTTTECYGQPICGDIHSNPAWQTQNVAWWENLTRPTCNPATDSRERRFRDADDLVSDLSDPNAFSDGIICFTQIIKVIDNTPPQFFDVPRDTTVADVSNSCEGTVQLIIKAKDVCNSTRLGEENLRFTWRVVYKFQPSTTIQQGTGNILNVTLPYGKETMVYWTVTDACGNASYYQHTLLVKDSKAPTVNCIHKNTVLAGGNGIGSSTVAAAEMAGILSDNCTNAAFLQSKLAISRVSEGLTQYPSVPKTFLTFSCAEAGQMIPVQLWTIDEAGNANFCQANITVQDNNNACSIGKATVQGLITTETGKLVNNVKLTAYTNGTFIDSVKSNISGSFSIINLAQGQNYQVKASKNDNLFNGLSTFDIALISKHILGIEEFNTPYKMIAADINRDGDVNALDMALLRRIILRSMTTLPNNNTSWRFIDKNYVFQNLTNPFGEDFPEVVNISNTPEAAKADFVAVKVGDVNNSSNTSNLIENNGANVEVRQESLVFEIEDKKLLKGEEYILSLTSPNFDAAGFQFMLNTEGVEIVKIEKTHLSQLSDNNFNLTKNALAVSWNGSTNSPVNDVFSLVIKATKEGLLSDMLSISSHILTPEAFDKAGNLKNIKLSFRNIEKTELVENAVNTEGGSFKVFQNEPNPFDSDTKIGFNLPKEAQVNFTVFDASGRILKKVSQNFAKGYNHIQLQKSDLDATGVLFYRIETPTHAAVKKMVVVN